MNTFSLYTALLLALSINAFPSQHKDSHKGYTAQSQASPSYLPTSSGYSPINVHQTLSSASNPTPAGYSSRISSGQNSQLDAAAGGYGHGGAPAEKGFRATEGLAANGGSEERPTTPTGFGVEGFKKPGPVPFFGSGNQQAPGLTRGQKGLTTGSAFPPSTGDYIEADQQTGPVIHSALRTQTGEAPSGHAADQVYSIHPPPSCQVVLAWTPKKLHPLTKDTPQQVTLHSPGSSLSSKFDLIQASHMQLGLTVLRRLHLVVLHAPMRFAKDIPIRLSNELLPAKVYTPEPSIGASYPDDAGPQFAADLQPNAGPWQDSAGRRQDVAIIDHPAAIHRLFLLKGQFQSSKTIL
ncbi:hypothetical protein Pst134EB_023564 [Puccinia striiformis f. sp. tritici]|nr:hypothetical protein Pst134EB_023564 [Puccinia striiformis f. sp. tritici]